MDQNHCGTGPLCSDVATIAWQVGYESPSQFTREYRRSFGAAPLQDVETLRQQGMSL